MKKEQISKTKTILLSIIIAIVLTGFVLYFIQSFYISPKYEDFCSSKNINAIPTDENITREICENYGGTWESSQIQDSKNLNGYCNFYSKCSEEYNDAREKYNLVIFIITLVTGIISVILGIILTIPSVSTGLMLGGTFLTFYGTAIYWSDLSNWLKTLILGIVLGILIWLAYKKLKN